MDILDRMYTKYSGISSLQNGLTLKQFRDCAYDLLAQYTTYYTDNEVIDDLFKNNKNAVDNWVLSFSGTGLGILHQGNKEFIKTIRDNYESLEAIIIEDKYKVLKLMPDIDNYMYNKFYKNTELIEKAYELVSDVIHISKEQLINFFQTDKLGMTPFYGGKKTSKLFPNSCLSFSNGIGYLIFEDTLC